MIATATSAFEINLPNAATWFYFSALLAAALFFKFTRLLSIRNWDLVALYLPMPGFLLLDPNLNLQFWGYIWLLAASGYFFCRCLFDLTLVRRPSLSPNLTFGGLAWLSSALFVSLIAVAVRHPNENSEQQESAPVPMDPMRKLGEKAILEHRPDVIDQASLEESLELWVERGLTVICHLSIAVGLILIGWRHFEDLHSGMAAATCYLLLPYTFLLLPRTALGVGRWDHAWPMALMVWMVYCFRRPRLVGFFLGLAAGTVIFPALLFPLWWSFYRRRGGSRFTWTFAITACLCLAVIATVLWLNDAPPRNLFFGWKLSAWLPWLQPQAEMPGVWQATALHWAYRLPIFLAYVAFIGTTAFWPSPKNLAHVIALSVAVLVGIQFWYADRGGIYILWYLPLLLLLVFRPNLTTCQPQPPGEDWMTRLGGKMAQQGRRILRRFQPVGRAHPVSRPSS